MARCLRCDSVPTIRAHLIPQAFAREVRGEDQQLALTDRKLAGFQPTQNGRFDSNILCRHCDNKLGDNENFAFRFFKAAREATAARSDPRIAEASVGGDRLIRFAAGICWKFAVTRPDYGRIDVGPYKEILAEVAFGSEPIPTSIDMMMVRLKAVQFEETFFRCPMPDRQSSVNVVRMTLGGFLMQLKIDKRPPPPKMGPAEVWLRGRPSLSFFVLPMSWFEEGQMVAQDSWSNPRLAQFFLKPFIQQIAELEGRQIPIEEVSVRFVQKLDLDQER